MKLGKTVKNMGNVLAKIVKKSIFSKMRLNQFTNVETRFISFKDLSCISRSKRIFRQYLKCLLYSCNSANWFLDELKEYRGMKL